MTRIVVLSSAAPGSVFDEAAIFNRQLSPVSMAALWAAVASGVSTDPQAELGWEEIYGSDQPLTAADVPVITNGITRVRYQVANGSYAVDLYAPGLGWVEQGRVTVWTDDNGTLIAHSVVLKADIMEWTPERAVIRTSTLAVSGANNYRLETYITLQRGWTAPRFECYPSPNAAGAALGAHIRWSAAGTIDPYMLIAGNAAHPLYQSDVGVSWPSLTPDDFTAANSQPWVALLGGDHTVGIAVVRAAIRIRRYDDTAAYGAAHKAVAVCADYGTAQAGYVSARLGFSQESPVLDGEAYVVAGGTRTVVADAGAADGQAVNDTQTTAAANTIATPAGLLAWMKPGKYAMWAQVHVTTNGDTGSVEGGFFASPAAGSGYGSVATFTSTTFVWVYLGESTLTDPAAAVFNLAVWRSAGVGTTGMRVDRIMLVPMEQRQSSLGKTPSYDGVRDLAASNLYDARAVPTTLAR